MGGQKQVAAFMDHYGKLYGARWPALYHAMLQPSRHVARVNKFAFASPSSPRSFPFSLLPSSRTSNENDLSELERTMRRLARVGTAATAALASAQEEEGTLRLLAVPGQPRLPLCLVGHEDEPNCFAQPATARAWLAGTVVEEGQEEEGDEDGRSRYGSDGSDGSDGGTSGEEEEKEEQATSRPPHQQQPPPGLLPYYLMDLASILAALALDVQEGHVVADICAAPGE